MKYSFFTLICIRYFSCYTLYRNQQYSNWKIGLLSYHDYNLMGSCDNITFQALSCWGNISVSTVCTRTINHCYKFVAAKPLGKTPTIDRTASLWDGWYICCQSVFSIKFSFWKYTCFHTSALSVRTNRESSTTCNSLVSPLIPEIREHNPLWR